MKRVLLLWFAAAGLAVVLAGCASRIPPRRNLPEWVQKIYLPIFKNETSEPGLEEVGTRLAVEEFLADGRLEIVSKSEDADLIVDVTLVDYSEGVQGFERDRFPSHSALNAVARVELYEPSNRKVPFARLNNAIASHSYTSDYRRIDMTLDVDAREALMRKLAWAIVGQVLAGFKPGGEETYKQTVAPEVKSETYLKRRLPKEHW